MGVRVRVQAGLGKGLIKVLGKGQYKLLYIFSNNIEIYEESVPWTKNIPHYAVKFEAKVRRIELSYESLYCPAKV